MAVRSKTSWPVMVLVMRSMSSGLISRYGKTDMENLLLGLMETQSADCAKKRPQLENGASGSPCDRYGPAQFNMTRLCCLFSYPSHPATDCSVSCLRIRPVGFESQGRERIELLTTHFKLASADYLSAWAERNIQHRDQLVSESDAHSVLHDLPTSARIASWAYQQTFMPEG